MIEHLLYIVIFMYTCGVINTIALHSSTKQEWNWVTKMSTIFWFVNSIILLGMLIFKGLKQKVHE